MAEEGDIEIVVGTYEELILAYKLEENEGEFQLVESFSNHSHCGSIRSIASNSKFLVSGSTDETIKIFNIHRRVELGSLIQHEGNVNALEFYKNAFLFSGSEDGTICIWSVRNWNCEKILRGHKKGITSLSIHPSGKLALSLSKDRSLRTWNLIKGRSAYVTNIKTVGDIVKWSPEGNFYAVVKNFTVDLYNVATASVAHVFEFGKKILALEFLDEHNLVVGGEGGFLNVYSYKKTVAINKIQAHDTRVKSLIAVKTLDKGLWLFSASSDGIIKMWKFQVDKLDEAPVLVAEVNAGCRITCMTVITKPNKTEAKDETVDEIPSLVGSSDDVANEEEKVHESPEGGSTTPVPLKRIRFQMGASDKKKRRF